MSALGNLVNYNIHDGYREKFCLIFCYSYEMKEEA